MRNFFNKSKFRQMMRYETYKPSGIEWIGDIPEHWEVKRVKDITQFNYGDTLIGEDRIDGEVPVYGSNGITGVNDKPNTKAPCIIVGRKGSFGKINFSDIECFAIDTTFYIDSTASSQNLKWLYYALDNIGLDKLSKDTGVPGLNREDAYKERLPFPPLPEQASISTYLDSQTQKIDQLIANKKAQVDRLKELRQIEINNAVTKGLNPNAPMKDSGIEWLGEIPGHWEVKRLKDLASVRGRIGFRGYNVEDLVDEGALTIGAKHINSSHQLNFDDPEYLSWEKYYESPEIMVKVGDVLIVQRGSVGKFAVVEDEIGPATINPSMILLRLNKRINYKFLFWVFLGEYIGNIIKTIVSSTAVPMISQLQAGQFRVILPPLAEQLQIAEHLKERTAAIDKLIKNTVARIEKLQELRKIKIYEAVTGKAKCHA